MAKYIAQIIVAGTQVVARAFARAIKQEIEASQQAASRLGNAKTRSERITNQKLGLSVEEAKQILNVSNLTKEEVNNKYQALFKANDKSNGSFYLLSKIVRAKERLDHELSQEQENSQEKSGEQSSSKT